MRSSRVGGQYQRQRLAFLVVSVVVVGLIIAVSRRPATFVLLPLPLVLLYLFLAARRAFSAVGPGWFYERAEGFGAGRWTRFSDIASARIRQGNGATLLYGTTKDNSTFRYNQPYLDRKTPVAVAFMDQLLESPAQVSPEVRSHLEQLVR